MHDQREASRVALELLDVSLDDPLEPVGGAGQPPSRNLGARWAAGVGLVVVIAVAALLWTRQPTVEAAPDAPDAPFGLEGFAELYVAAYITASGEEGTAALKRFYADAPAIAGADRADRYVMRAAAIRATPTTDGVWEVSVAADVLTFDGVGYTSDGTHYYLVDIAETPGGLSATSLPVRTGPPPPAPIVGRAAGLEVHDAATLALAAGFLGAYLAGEGDLRSFAVADSGLTAVTPPPFVAIELTAVAAIGADHSGSRLHILATGTTAKGSVATIEYHLSVVVRGSALAVSQVHGGPPTTGPGGS